MNQSINTDSKNSKEPQQKYRLGTVSIKVLGGLKRFYRRLTSPSASIMAQNIQLFVCLEEESSIVWRSVFGMNGHSSMFLNKGFSVSCYQQNADIDCMYLRLC